MADFLIYSGYLILFINLILYNFSFLYRRKANIFFIGYLIFSLGMQITMEVLYQLGFHNLVVVNIFFLGNFILLSLFFKSFSKTREQENFIGYTLVAAVGAIIVQNWRDTQLLFQFNLFAITLTAALLICYALIHLYNQLGTDKSYYYVTVGIVIYLLSSTVLYLIGNLTQNLSPDIKYLSWQLNALLVIVLQLFYCYEWMVTFSKKNEKKTINF
ncbi:hypothetical protein AP058_00968 [Flavobacterium sp. TAB 87]|nr:hypothetical protein AP058_00968 [Flavobacterium sp. TAB 87]